MDSVGKGARYSVEHMRNLTSAELETQWKKLNASNYAVTSNATARYNCLAFANGDERHWWDLGNGGRYYWPSHIKKEWTLDAWTKIFESGGYSKSGNRDAEAGKQKIAIYVDLEDLTPTHVAVSEGAMWKSKLGRLQDIEHATLDSLEGSEGYEYGIVEIVFERLLK